MVTILSTLSYNQYHINPRPFVLHRNMSTFEISNCKKYAPISDIKSWNVFNFLIIMMAYWTQNGTKTLHPQRYLYSSKLLDLFCVVKISNFNEISMATQKSKWFHHWLEVKYFKVIFSWKTRHNLFDCERLP